MNTYCDKLTMDLASEYLRLATQCQSIDYGDPHSVRQFNEASDRMRKIAQDAESFGPKTLQSLVRILDDPVAGIWLAHHLVELTTIDSATQDDCFRVVRGAVARLEQEGKGAQAMGERLWLEEWGTN